jgi:acyl-CoA synthetase (AMP-forming)/AMP-acid ligase II
MVIGDIARKNARLQGERVAVSCRRRVYTFAEVNRLANRVANALIERAAGKGQRVAYLSKNSAEYASVQFGIAKTGAAAVPLNVRLAVPELDYILTDSDPAVLIFESDCAAAVQELVARRPGLPILELPSTADGDIVATTPWLREASADEPGIHVEESDLLFVIYTSGTTGRPKGAMLTHRNIIWANHNYALEFRLRPEDVGLHPMPLFHAGGGSIFIGTLFAGCRAVIVRDFSPAEVLDLIEEERVTFAILVPAMIIRLLEHPDVVSRDFRSLRLIMYGAAPMPLDRLRRAMEVFGCSFINSYGQTEAAPSITFLRPEEHRPDDGPVWARRLGSVGRETYNVEARVVNESGRNVRPGEVGEIVCRGNNVMAGYWRQPEATAAAIRDGWLCTGDLATVDEEGYLYLAGRKKELIISGGENIYPAEVEQALFAHPAVLEVAVFGLPDAVWGERVAAAIVLRPGCALTVDDVTEFCRVRLAGYKRPRTVCFVEALPRNATGKVLKHVLRSQFREQVEARTET